MIISFWIEVYLYLFPLKKLYTEVCVKGENKKSTIFFTKSQLECLNRVKDKYPKYSKKIETYVKLNRMRNQIGLASIGLIFLFWVFGIIEYKSSSEKTPTVTTKTTITIVEGNKTTVKVYKNLEDFLK